ncbi:hypothetical protein B0H13DRAFT_2125610 [Mycena leptocephala]|nr:hypothetical protein B0H13DRAFT_2125610 [Mycena leptocephala]
MDAEPSAESSTRRATRTATKKRKSDSNDASTGGPAPKRPRTAKKGRLAGLLSISLDIFGNLHPLDLLRLSRVSKEFRDLLMHRSSISVWRSSLNNVVPDLPSCPPNMNEPQWISLVFDATCQVCQKIARKVDWSLYIRICTKCAKTHLASRMRSLDRVGTDIVNFKALILTRADHTKAYKEIYFTPELEKIKTAYNAIADPEEKEKFVQERKELLKTLAEHAKLCEAWAESVADNRSTELADLKEERYLAIVAKLTALGWGSEITSILPCDSLRSHRLVKQPNLLTERTWKTIQSDMVQYMEQMKAKRLAREHAALVVTRKAIATKVLRTFKRYPCAASDVSVDEQSFEALLPEFPGMIATWRERLVDEMAKVYKRCNKEESAMLDDDDVKTRLMLAKTVFKCVTCGDDDLDPFFHDILAFAASAYGTEKRCRPLYYPTVLSHRCLTRTPDYSMLMLMMLCIVEKIVVACGMDPATTTVEDMDTANPRLACHACAERPSNAAGASTSAASTSAASTSAASTSASANTESKQPATVNAYSWRNAVRHHGELHWRLPTAWYMLDEADAAAARALEADAEIVRDESDDELDYTSTAAVNEDPDNASATTEDAEIKESEVTQDADMPAVADDAEAASDGVRILPSQLPEAVWSCGHCIDAPNEAPPKTLSEILKHLTDRHDCLTPPTLNEDYYRSLAAPDIYSKQHFPAPTLKGARRQSVWDHLGFAFDSDDDEDGFDDYMMW